MAQDCDASVGNNQEDGDDQCDGVDFSRPLLSACAMKIAPFW